MEDMGLDLFQDFYRNKIILVTGHTGFKGSWLSIWLKELGADVIGYSLDPYSDKDNFCVSHLDKRIIDIRADIRDSETLDSVIKKYKPEIIFHLAAQPLVRLSYEKPQETYDINVMGTLNILERIRGNQCVKVGVMITTDKCYENKEQMWAYREIDPMGGYDPYSSSKGCCELMISSYRNSFFYKNGEYKKAVASARAGNVVGGGDWAKDRIVPDCIRSFSKEEVVEIRNPSSIRPWQHVLEPLYGYMLLAKKLYYNGRRFSSGWNFGTDIDKAVPVSTIVDLLINYWEGGQWKEVLTDTQLHEANLLTLDCTKAKKLLKWKPVMTIEETIDYTVRWYKENINEDMYDFNVNQIRDYCKLRRQGR